MFVIKGCTMLKTSPSALTLIPQVGGMASITPSVHGNRRELLSLCISYERGGAVGGERAVRKGGRKGRREGGKGGGLRVEG